MLFWVTNLFAQGPDTLWTRTYGEGQGFSVQQTSDGGYIIVGNFLIKADANGDSIWTRPYGGRSVQQTSDGGYIIVGGSPDVSLRKTDANGNKLWTKRYGGALDDRGSSVQQISDGGYIIAGSTWSFGQGRDNVYLIRTNTNGDTVWTRTYGGIGYDGGRSVQQTTDGGYIITGWISSYQSGLWDYDVYLIKTDENGDTLWTRTYGGVNYDEGFSIQQTSDGGYIITGETTSFGLHGPNVYLIKTDANGDTLWTRTYAGTGYGRGRSVQQTADGGYVIAGVTRLVGVGHYHDAYLMKMDANGDTLWTKAYEGVDDNAANSVDQTSDGGYILTGYTSRSYSERSGDVWLIRVASVLAPVITNIVDLPNDQGKQVRVSWTKSSLDGVLGDSTVMEYSLWRRIDPLPEDSRVPVNQESVDYQMGKLNSLAVKYPNETFELLDDPLPPGEWDLVLTVPAIGSETYDTVAPTLADSTATQGMYWSVFVIIAHTADSLIFYVSGPRRGYSLDNLAPNAPTDLLASVTKTWIKLTWKGVLDEDFSYYAIYRSLKSNFDPTTLEPHATTVNTFFFDVEVEGNTEYYYRVSAFDFSGNESEFSQEVSAIALGVQHQNSVPITYILLQNYPNPVVNATSIGYQLSEDSHVTLAIYNTLGRLVRTLVDENVKPGKHQASWDGKDYKGQRVVPGIYFYRIETKNLSDTNKFILLR